MESQRERASIGLVTIWGEGQGVDRLSLRARIQHLARRVRENIARSPMTTFLTTVTIAIALLMLGVFMLLVRNCESAISRESGAVQINVFLVDAVGVADVQSISEQIASVAGRAAVVHTDKAQALERFRRMLGDDAVVLEGLDATNPLPQSLDIAVEQPDEAESLYGKITERLSGDPRIESIRYSRGVMQQLKRILKVVEVGGVFGGLFILAITAFIITSTIKLALYAHRMEVEIMKLVGARRAAIYAPYVVEGLLQGLIGAGLGVLVLLSVFLFIRNALLQTEALHLLFPQFHFLSWWGIGSILAAGGLVGVIGSFLAVRRFLTVEE